MHLLRPIAFLLVITCLVSAEVSPGVAVVELFTSEGCSSCPPADQAFNLLVSKAREQKAPILLLAFHVDYWDTLNTPHGPWKDPFSNPAHTAYQGRYVQALPPMMGERKVRFTPCFLVNGRAVSRAKGFQAGFQQALTTALSMKPACAVDLDCKPGSNDGTLEITYTIDHVPEHAHLNLALVERALVSEVTAGENHGATLHHDNVVRAFEQIPLEQRRGLSGQHTISIPAGVVGELTSLIAYVQSDDMATLGGSEQDLAALLARQTPSEATCEGGVCIDPTAAE